MKYLLVLFSMFSICAFAADNWYPVGKTGRPNYGDKNQCQSVEGQTCYDVTACPLEQCSIDPVLGTYSIDASKVATIQASQTEMQNKTTKLQSIQTALKNCIQNWASLTAGQKDTCLAGAVKMTIISNLQSGDL